MPLYERVRSSVTNPFASFRIYEIIIAIVCISIPLLLMTFDTDTYYPKRVSPIMVEEIKSNMASDTTFIIIPKDRLGFRYSISDYVYSSNSYLFGMLLCIGAMLFIFNGAVYYKSQHTLQLSRKGKWYNVILGVSLLGIICTSHRDAELLHYIFAILFFFGNAVVIGLFYNKNDKKKSIFMSLLTILFLSLSIFIDSITLLWSEWLSLTVIGIHLILESRAKNNQE